LLAKNVVAKLKYRAQDFFYHFVIFRHGETVRGIDGAQIRAIAVATCRFLQTNDRSVTAVITDEDQYLQTRHYWPVSGQDRAGIPLL
jgi:hypothetical protein